MHQSRLRCIASLSPVCLALVMMMPAVVGGQVSGAAGDSNVVSGIHRLVTIGSPDDEDLRTRQLAGASAGGYLLRSPSSLTTRLAMDGHRPRTVLLAPSFRATYNSDLPYSLNDGALWAGRGTNVEILLGGAMQWRRLRVIVAPSLVYSQNQPYALADPTISPQVPPSRNPFSSPWHAGSQSIDLPIRFGDLPSTRLTAGQSSLMVTAGAIELGAATENEWWGPGIRNSLLLSNNAEGFPHLELRTAHPINTPLGPVEGRWIAGGLKESAYFDFDPGNDLRSLALLGLTLAPRGTNGLTIGVARAVYQKTGGWGTALTNFPQAFSHVGHPDEVPLNDSVTAGGRDALASVFVRWVLPASGAEVYGEWGRAQAPHSLRDFLEQPQHSQGYTLGMQWRGQEIASTHGRLRMQAEATYVEQSTTYRFRPEGSWYTSHAVPQGYTERGQPLGAAIGPGSSSQFIALDHLSASWQVGAYLTRVRWLDDAETQKRLPIPSTYCSHDVSTLPGVRGRATTPFGTLFADYSSGWRLNVFFDEAGCSGSRRDTRNKSLTIGFSPR